MICDDVLFDGSETDDIVLSHPDTSYGDSDPFARDRLRHPARRSSVPVVAAGAPRAPMRIGHGMLVGTRVAWRPGDPFGQAAREYSPGLAWRRILSSACFTAACGLIAVWLLHTLFA